MRNAVGSLARAAGLNDEKIEDVRLAVSEAATNAVQHGGAAGAEMSVQAGVVRGELRISISDEGGGMRARADSPGLGLGLPIIAAITDRLEVASNGKGTTVTIVFRCE
jgi:anti-sigma regulatory factor (Ser/Thr protein kinase)